MRFDKQELKGAATIGIMGGSMVGQAIGWNRAHNENKRSGNGFFSRMGNHVGKNLVDGTIGYVGGGAIGGAAYLGYHAMRRR